jgi:hypothetical protein
MSYGNSSADAWGRAAERAMAKAFTYCGYGYFVLPVHLIDAGSAPMLIGEFRKIIAPDIQVCKNGMTSWVDIKFKASPVLYNKTGKWRHGTDLHKWRAYIEAERETGFPGAIAVLQYKPGPDSPPNPVWYLQTLAQLACTVQEDSRPTQRAPRGMAYWNVDEMDFKGPLDIATPNTPLLTRTIHAWERGRSASFIEQQRSLFSY